MPPEQPRSPRPRSERRTGTRRVDEAWIPGTRPIDDPPADDGVGAAALAELERRTGAAEPVAAEAPRDDPDDLSLSQLADELAAHNGVAPDGDEEDAE